MIATTKGIDMGRRSQYSAKKRSKEIARKKKKEKKAQKKLEKATANEEESLELPENDPDAQDNE